MRVLAAVATVLWARSGLALVAPQRPVAREATRVAATYTVTVDLPSGEMASFPCADDEFILDAAEEAGLELPSSCRSGACTSCQGRVLSGSVSMDDQSTLEDEHIAVGYVCTCIAYPESDVRFVSHQMDNFENGVMKFDDAPAAAEPPAAAPAAPPAPAAPKAVPVVTPVVATTPPPAMPSSNGVRLDDAKVTIAKKTLAVLRECVAGDAQLETKCDELAMLLEGGTKPEYVPYRSEDTGYTIWLNKNDPTNSYYEYH